MSKMNGVFRITRGKEHKSRDEIVLDFSKFPIQKRGKLCIADINFNSTPLKNMDLETTDNIRVYIELPNGLFFREKKENADFKMITEVNVSNILTSKQKIFSLKPITFDLLKNKKIYKKSNKGYFYLELDKSGRKLGYEKMDPEKFGMKISYEYSPHFSKNKF